MKSAALILAALAIAATAQAGRVHGTCSIIVNHATDYADMDCVANMPDGSQRKAYRKALGPYPKICDSQGVICWQMNHNSPQSIEIFYANQRRGTNGSVSNHSTGGLHDVWRNTYSVDF